jgi:hypothetical protein
MSSAGATPKRVVLGTAAGSAARCGADGCCDSAGKNIHWPPVYDRPVQVVFNFRNDFDHAARRPKLGQSGRDRIRRHPARKFSLIGRTDELSHAGCVGCNPSADKHQSSFGCRNRPVVPRASQTDRERAEQMGRHAEDTDQHPGIAQSLPPTHHQHGHNRISNPIGRTAARAGSIVSHGGHSCAALAQNATSAWPGMAVLHHAALLPLRLSLCRQQIGIQEDFAAGPSGKRLPGGPIDKV